MSVEIRLLTVDELSEQLDTLAVANFAEVRPGETQALNVDFFRSGEKNGLIFIVGAVQAGNIIGYSITFVLPDMHTSAVLASNDVIYLDPKHRLGMTAVRLVRATEAEALRRGASIMQWNPLVDSRFTKLLSRLGYMPRSVTYRKELSDV